ncbi:hypothetical protein [Gordonia sp. NPDC003429]
MGNSTSEGDTVTVTDEATVVETTTDVQEPDTLDEDNRVHDDHGSDEPDTELADSESETEPDTFDRAYVEKLRQENGKYRQRAQRADDLARRLHRALVEQTGKLADPTDLAFDEDHLDDADSLTAAIDTLLAAKPHLAARRVAGDIGQGASKSSDGVNLLGILRGHS